MPKQILFGETARKKVASGVDQAARAVKATLGPRGRNVIMARSYGGPKITNDGVSIAKDISLQDPFEDLGAQIVKEVAEKTNEGGGDGTTTSVVLLESLVVKGMDRINKGANAMAVRSGMEKALGDVRAVLLANAKPVSGKKDIARVAAVSAESEELGATIAEVVEKVGKNGVITVEESQGTEMSYELTQGLQVDRGYVSAYMVTNPERQESESKDPYVLVTDKSIGVVGEIIPILEMVAKMGGKELVIICEDVGGEALPTFILNRVRGGFNVLAIKAPGFGEKKTEFLEDIALVTGATVISDQTGIKLDTVTIDMLGKASRIVATKDTTTIVGGSGKKVDVSERVEQLKAQLPNVKSKFDKEHLEQRIAKLSGGVAVIRVGASTETEMKYLKDKVEDAVKATKASIEAGIVPGGGSALARVESQLKKRPSMDESELAGYSIVLSSLSAPLRQILENSGREDAELIVAKIQEGEGNIGYDAKDQAYVTDMIAKGIIDPVKVTINAIENSISAAAILLTMEVAVVDLPEPKSNNDQGMGMM